jgi:zinc protease
MHRFLKSAAAPILALGLVAAACSPSDSGDAAATTGSTPSTTATTTTTTTTRPPPTTTTTTILPRPSAAIPTFEDDAEMVTVDRAVTIGTLENGLTYYIRHNELPGSRAQLRLAVKAGSVQEADDQHGVAHYLEHMLFNGTEKYPANELIDVLQSFGSEFGPDINAFTSYEETVYELNLPVDSEGLLETGLDVLREWASAATIDPEEVELERGVLLEEWRVRSQSYRGRYFDGVSEVLLGGTPYEGQSPLADGPMLDATTPETLRRFYEDWYRPDNMAVVAVGDFDVNEVEDIIIDLFGSLESRSGPQPPVITTDPASEPEFFVLADPEYRQSFIELNYALPRLEPGTVGSIRQQMALDVAWRVVATRLEEDVLLGGVPFHAASGAANPLVRTQRSPGIAAFSDSAELAETAHLLLAEVERVLIHGFEEGEVDRAIEEFVSAADAALARADTIQDATYADAYVQNFLGDEPIPQTSIEARLRKRLLDEMTVSQVVDTFRASVHSTEPFVIAVAPEDAASDLPTAEDLLATIETIRSSNLPARTDTTVEIDTLMDTPPRGTIDDVLMFEGTNIEIGIFGNGLTMVMFPTEIVEGRVFFGAQSFGGWSLLDPADATEAQLISSIVRQSGVAEFDQVSLDRFLTDKTVSVSPFIGETIEGFSGSAATEDLETLFQLIHLYMTEPRATEAALGIRRDALRASAEDPNSDPQTALAVALADVRFNDQRFSPVQTIEDLETFELATALGLYEDRFGDAGDFVFVFAGDLDQEAVLELALEYLASLPGGGVGEDYANVRTERSPAIAERIVEAGAGELGEVVLQWDKTMALDEETRIQARILELVIRQRLTDRIREELSATYSPSTFVSRVDTPQNALELIVAISADPADLDRIVEEVVADFTDLRTNGPTTQEMETAREQLVRELELFSNELLIQLFTFYARMPEEFSEFFEQIPLALAASRGDIRGLAQTLIDLEDYIVVRLVPEDFGG